MTYEELITTIKDIPIEKRLIAITYEVGKSFDIQLNGSIYYLKLEHGYAKQSDEGLYKMILKSVNGIQTSTPSKIDCSYEQVIEMLYHHYPFGIDDNSNCIVTDVNQNIIAIQYNNLAYTTTVKTLAVNPNPFIIINNKKKIAGVYKYKDFEFLLPTIKKICAEL